MITKWCRLEKLIGSENLALLQTKKVLVIGLGGVGGYVVEGLIRSGLEDLTIVDHDSVDITNINRQIIATEETIGKKKADLLKERCLAINEKARITSKVVFVEEDNIEELFTKKYDYVIDACDTIATKKLLIKKCLTEKVPIISCMGTARKLDPTKLEITDIKKTSYDPLAKIIRQYMKTSFPDKKLYVLSSKEAPQKENSKVLSSSIFVPAIAGLLIANFVIQELIKEKGFYNKQ